ncbi:MAG: MFS transporter [Pseudomonadota bacterium]|nr:MFS transporter [Pseudomonadota bacterium]
MTIMLCMIAALFEGADNIALALAAPRLALDYALAPYQIGIALSASLIGMMVGAAIGGRLADQLGRKVVLIGSMIALGLFSLATVATREFQPLVLMRFLAGAGLGGAFPILIALASEISHPDHRARTISLVHSGQPLGAAVLSLIVALGSSGFNWRIIFWIGGLGPLAIALMLTIFLSEPESYRNAQRVPHGRGALTIGTTLFGQGRAATTLALWLSCIFTLFVVYLLLNWVPSLMVAKGLSRPEGATAAMALHIGATLGTVTAGTMADRYDRRILIVFMYLGFAVSLAALAYFGSFGPLVFGCGLVGFFMLACQLILYACAAQAYPIVVRGTGVGATIALGRLGGIAAPITAGALLSTGYGASAVLAAAIPGVVLAAIFALALTLLLQKGRADTGVQVSVVSTN